MRTYDFSPLWRSTIGFDRLFDLAEMAQRERAGEDNYPPYNIEKTGDDSYRLSLAVAGFSADDIELTVKENTLVVAGRVAGENGKGEYLHRGITARAFTRRFVLADHMVVEGADIANGLLNVTIKRVVPESLKPRRIEVKTAAKAPSLVNSAADQAQLPQAA